MELPIAWSSSEVSLLKLRSCRENSLLTKQIVGKLKLWRDLRLVWQVG